MNAPRISLVVLEIIKLLNEHPELAEDDVLRADMIEGETDANEILRKIEAERQNSLCMAGATATRIAELELRQQRFEKREKAMRDLAFKIMQAADLRKIELPEATYSVRNVAPKVMITNEDALPDAACTLIRKPVMKAIKELLERGPIPGATMSNGAETLSIRTR